MTQAGTRPAAWVEQVVEGVRVLHSHGHQGEIPRDQALRALADKATQAQPLAAHGEIGNGRADESRADNVRSTDFGNSQAYLLRRLARDAPEVLDRVKSGEIKSARAAAIEAGIIKPVPTVRLVDDPSRIGMAQDNPKMAQDCSGSIPSRLKTARDRCSSSSSCGPACGQ